MKEVMVKEEVDEKHKTVHSMDLIREALQTYRAGSYISDTSSTYTCSDYTDSDISEFDSEKNFDMITIDLETDNAHTDGRRTSTESSDLNFVQEESAKPQRKLKEKEICFESCMTSTLSFIINSLTYCCFRINVTEEDQGS